MTRPAQITLLLATLLLTTGCIGLLDGDEELDVSSIRASAPPEQTGDVVAFDLYLSMTTIQIEPGTSVMAWGFSLSPNEKPTVPGPEIRVTEGQLVRITFHNQHNMIHTIHWHGIHVPWSMDGVPFVSQDPIPPGESFTYEFVAGPAGTHMYHCHVDTKHHVDMGMYGPLIVEPREEDRDEKEVDFDREATLMLDEWDKDHIHNTSGLGSGVGFNDSGNPLHAAETAEQQARDTLNRPPNPQAEDNAGSTSPLQDQRDWYPITYPAYEPSYDSYLINGKAFPLTETLNIAEDERLKVRLMNIGSMPHSMHLHGHSFLVTHKDGYKLEAPYRGDTILIGPGERYDLLIDGVNPGVWLFHDHGLASQNNHVYPGGMFTMLVYDQYQDQADTLFEPGASGNMLEWYKR